MKKYCPFNRDGSWNLECGEECTLWMDKYGDDGGCAFAWIVEELRDIGHGIEAIVSLK